MITVNQDNYKVDISKILLGYMGETNSRTIAIYYPLIWEVDDYRVRLEYSDGVVYEVPIRRNAITITGSMLREVGEINMQWLAVKSDGESYELVAKSNIFKGVIKPSISDDIAPIPTYEQSITVLEKVLEADREIANKVAAAESAKSDAIAAEIAVEDLAESIDEDAEAIEENITLANQTLESISTLAETAEDYLEQVIDAVEEVQDTVTQVQHNTSDISDLKQDSGSWKESLFGKDKLTKLKRSALSSSNYGLKSDGTLEFKVGYKVFVYDITSLNSFLVKNTVDSPIAFYSTTIPVSADYKSIAPEYVISVTSLTADKQTIFKIPEDAVSFGITLPKDDNDVNIVIGINDNAQDGLADFNLMTENLLNPEFVYDRPDNNNYQYTGNIEVEPNTTYVVSQNGKQLSQIYPHTNYKGQFLDENLNEISKIETNPFTTPENCKYIYLTAGSPDKFENYKLEKGSVFTAYVPYGMKQNYPDYYTSPFRNKKFCAIGDSITAGVNGVASYVKSLADRLAMKWLYNAQNPTAISGSSVAKYGQGDTTREDYMCSNARVNAIPQDSEVILIMGGTNDTSTQQITLGTLDGEHVETTFYGAYQLMLDRIYARCPNADIFLCEMPYAHGMTTGAKQYFEQRQQAIRDIAYKYGCPLLNTRAEGVNEANYSLYRGDESHPNDKVHPNELGHARLASLFAAQMKAYRG